MPQPQCDSYQNCPYVLDEAQRAEAATSRLHNKPETSAGKECQLLPDNSDWDDSPGVGEGKVTSPDHTGTS